MNIPGNAFLTITSDSIGSLTAIGGFYGAGIGENCYHGGGIIIVNGGSGGTGGKVSNYSYSGTGGTGGNVIITGGNVIASIGGGAGDTGGDGGDGGDFGYTGNSGSSGGSGSCKIINGSVKASSMAPTPTNATSTVYLTKITGLPVNTIVDYMVDGFSPVSCRTDASGCLYLWQPATGSPITILKKNAGTYYSASGTVITGSNSFAAATVATVKATTSVTVSQSSATLSYGNTVSLTATVSPTDATGSATGSIPISGAVGSSYSPSTDTGGTIYYYCEVTNTFGAATAATLSSVGKVTVNTAKAPVIGSSSSDTTVTQGDTATLSISASTTSGTLSYQWYSNITGSTTGATEIIGATDSAYSPSTASSGTTYYYCIVTSTLGISSLVITSNMVSVTVNDPPSTVTSVTVMPATVTVQKGNTQMFNNLCNDGRSGMDYQRNGYPGRKCGPNFRY